MVRIRALLGSLVCLVLLTACTAGASSHAGDPPCGALTLGDVAGPRPAYLDDAQLAVYPGRAALCRAMWLPGADRGFVPQGLALDGDTAWVSGYHDGAHTRPCQLVHVRLDGEPLVFQDRVVGRVRHREPVLCRHGGGLLRTAEGLWLAETHRLWLLDPALVGKGDPVLRGWRLEEPVRGSFLVPGASGRLGLGGYRAHDRGAVHWYDVATLLAPGRTVLAASRRDRSPGTSTAQRVLPRRVGIAPVRAQGAARIDGGAPTYVSSTSGCGKLALPGGTRVAFAPGAEDAEQQGALLWSVSEAGAFRYFRLGRPLVPMLAAYRLDRLLRGPAPTCPW